MSTPRSQREPRGPACGKPIVGWGFGRFEGSAAHDVDAARVTESRHVSGRPTRIRAKLAEPDSPKVQSARRLSGAAACPGRSAGRPVVDHAPPHRRSNRSTRPAMTKRCLGGVLPHQAAVAIETDVRPTWASPSGWPRNRGSPRRPARGSSAPGRCVRTARPMWTHQGRG